MSERTPDTPRRSAHRRQAPPRSRQRTSKIGVETARAGVPAGAREIAEALPGYNCGECGYVRCERFAEALAGGEAALDGCPVLLQERHRERRDRLQAILRVPVCRGGAGAVVGLLDGYEADFVLKPLPGEGSCREILHQFSRARTSAGQIIRYRPLGCPITHFARILEESDGLLTVHVVGPRHRFLDERFDFTEVGVCMVLGFEGTVEGKLPEVGETVRFKPDECMMQKVHSGVVVKVEGRTVLLEGIDLKVWAPPVRRDRRDGGV